MPAVTPTVGDIARYLETWAPSSLAEPWDNVGLQVGDPARPAGKVLVVLDVDRQAVVEACQKGCGLIVAHHPLLFRPLRSVRSDHGAGALVLQLAESGIAVFCAHTNLDAAPGGVNDVLAARVGVTDCRPLLPAWSASQREAVGGRFVKLVVFVPESHLGDIEKALADSGAGVIGKYSHCTFQLAGTGTFQPLPGAEPYAGRVGEVERAPEIRVEAVVEGWRVQQVVKAVRAVHPYEEMAYDVYPLLSEATATAGLGRIGRLVSGEGGKAMTVADFAGLVKKGLGVRSVKFSGSPAGCVETVAVMSGAGGDALEAAAAAGADVLLTGELKYHEWLRAAELGLNVLAAGHRETESVVLGEIARRLKDDLGCEALVGEAGAAEGAFGDL